MDIIITEPVVNQMIETGCLTSYYLDVELGSKKSKAKNDFEITMSLDKWNYSMNQGSFVLSELFCGMIDGLKVDTYMQEITLHGVTIQKMLDEIIIVPSAGRNYFEFSGDINILLDLLIRPRFNGLIVTPDVMSGIQVQLKSRYESVFEALERCLSGVDMRLHIEYKNAQIIVSAVNMNLHEDVEINNDYDIKMISEARQNYNHMIALGRGEMANRTIIELFCVNGEISEGPLPEGTLQRTYLYDYPGVESEEKLYSDAKKKMLSVCGYTSLTAELDGDFEVGDSLYIRERISGLYKKACIQQKIIKGTSEDLKIEYKVGE